MVLCQLVTSFPSLTLNANRPISKAYMSSLSDRITLLESMLMDKGVVPPPASHPPKTKHDSQNKSDEQQQQQRQTSSDGCPTSNQRAPPMNSPCDTPDSTNDFTKHDLGEMDHNDPIMTDSQMLQALSKEESPLRMLDSKQEDIVHRLLSTRGNLSFDQLSGRLRFFGPTANSHVYAETPDHLDSREPPEQVRRAERIIRSLSILTYDYLMDHFFEYYNTNIPVINRDAFEADRESQNPKFYSSFLHIAILAMGYRGCDTDRDDMRGISLGHRESTLHREAKYMLDIELERPGGIPSVQALLLLGDLECGVGRDNTGWMYAGESRQSQSTRDTNANSMTGMANRLAFDIGLHLDYRSNDMPVQEVQIRHMVMRACVIYDKYWALFLGRPTSIKSQDLSMELLSDKMVHLTSEAATPPERNLIMEIYEQLIELMELAGRIVESRDHHVLNKTNMDQNNIFFISEAEDNAYLQVINLDRQLQNWYHRLPDNLAWKPSNIKTAPYSFFLLHQQYHVSMILLHRPWARYGSITGDGSSTGSHPSPESGHIPVASDAASQHPGLGDSYYLGMGDPHSIIHDSRASLSRSICTQQAIRVARIFWQHRQRFDGRKIFVTGIQHAGTAVLALIAALAYQRSDSDRRMYIGYLEILSDALGDMSHTYHPAGRMDDLLKAVLAQIRLSIGDPPQTISCHQGFPFTTMSGSSGISASVVPSRREAADSDMGQPFKKMRPGNSRRASEFTRPPPPFFPSSETHAVQSHSAQSHHMFSAPELHQRHHSHVESMLFSLEATDGSHIDLDFLGGPAIKMDPSHEQGRADDGTLFTPSSDNWGLSSLHGGHQPGNTGFEPPMGFGSGPAGLSASSILAQSSALSNGLMSGTPFGLNKVDMDGVEDTCGNADMAVVNPELNGMSPVSLSGLVQSVETGPGSENETARNHDLDFFSFN